MSSPVYTISKSSFLKFEQCNKAFFFYKKHPYLRDKISIDKQLTFKRGHDVGYFAQQLFPGGTDVSKNTKGSAEALGLTQKLIEEKAPVIYEATFVFNGVLIMVDILNFQDGKYTAYEVKSSMKVSETYLKDAYLQYYVLKNILPGFDDLFLVTINPEYVREDDIDPKKLFRKRSVKAKAEENFTYFNYQVKAAHQVLEQNAIPNTAVGKHCFRPYQCDYFGTCWKDLLQQNSIFNLPLVDRGKLFELHAQGIRTINELSDELIEKPAAIKIKHAFVNNEAIVNKERIREFLMHIKEPFVAMDMEIWSPAIPQLKGSKPFEQIPFLVCFYNGEQSTYFFTAHQNDDRRLFAEELIRLSADYASVLVYDKTMETGIINSLIHCFPDLSEPLGELKSKFVDVFDVFLDLSYYHPAFKGNFSLKLVSSILLQDIHYTKISSGLEAMNYFEQYRITEDQNEKQILSQELVDYCTTDTVATLKLVEFLQSIVS